jgi:MFS family permease
VRVSLSARLGQETTGWVRSTATGAVDEQHGGMFAALRRYPIYRRLWLGMLAASLGQWTQQVGLGWLALSLTDSPFFVGLVGFMAGLPFLVVPIPAGVLVDRLDRRRLLLACQAAATLVAVLMAVDIVAGRVLPWHLLVAAFANGSLLAIMTPTQQSLVPGLVPREDLTNAIGLNSAGINVTRAAGPFVAGALIGSAGVGASFVLQAFALGLALILVTTMRLPTQPERAPFSGARGALAGIALIARRPDLRSLFLLASIPTFFVFPYVAFLPVFARDILAIGPSGFGLLMATSGVGAVVGSLLTAARRRETGTGRLLILLTVLYGALVVGIALSRTVYLTLPLLFTAGTLGSMYMSGNNALLQLRISHNVRGRVTSAYVLTWGLMPLGAMPMGLVADHLSTSTAVAGGAMLSSLLAAILGLRSRTLRSL